MAFYVGQKVVCIEDTFSPACVIKIPTLPKKGNVYTIREIYQHANGPMFYLHEISNPACLLDRDGGTYVEPCWPSFRFRPAVERKTDISIFEEMLTPTTREVETV